MHRRDLLPLLTETLERSDRYLRSLETRPVAPPASAVAALKRLDIPLQQDPIDPSAVIRELDEIVTPATMAMAGPRFFGFVIGGSLPASLAAHWLSSAWDQNTGLYKSTPGTSHLEEVSLRWLLDPRS
jgi:glutamate/tyrosine decarboxylase-like PLP-dependent enzyme